ncbi:MFS transporter [Lactiplantibacillus fabifermentans T30PCM01]|uniref:MFS family major facilitator transporter n=3 Tax=Lactiplantibacillus fabifermentans TaxID=483011 RepID=A0A0R2NVX8_9LACO|nr:MFS transporter [Lactiplantibacillus fabifermentans T30PCM01]KRO27907.1 MFS family major facilitator transporter [Lactiplantibacillus fabifermentans DSM 21115]
MFATPYHNNGGEGMILMKITMKQRSLVAGLFLIVFMIGADSFIISPLLPAIERSFHISVAQAALAVTSYAVCYAVGAPVIGPLGDHYSKRTLLLLGITVFSAGSLSCSLAPTNGWFEVSRAVAGLGAAMTLPNVWALIGATFTGAQLSMIMGITMAALSLSIAIGVPLGALLAQLANWRWAFGVSTGLTLLAGVVLTLVVPTETRPRTVLDYWGGHRQLAHNRPAIRALLVTLTWMVGFYAIYTFLGTFLSAQLQLNTSQAGLVFTVYGFCNFIASFASGPVMTRLGQRRVVQINGALSLLAIAGLVLGQTHLNVVIVSLGALAIVQGLGVTALNTLIVGIAPQQRSTVMACNSALLYLGLTLSSSIGGPVFVNWGFTGIGLVAVVMLGLAVVLVSQLKPA